MNITVSIGNDAPTALPDTGAVNEDATLTVATADGVIQSALAAGGIDSDLDGDTLNVIGVSTGTAASAAAVGTGNVATGLIGTYGTLTLNADGSYSYIADQVATDALAVGDTATDTFSYAISDGNGGTSFTTLTITVTGANDAPIVVIGSEVPNQTGTDNQAITPINVTGAFTDPDTTDVLTYTATGLPVGLTLDLNTGIISGTLDNSASQGGVAGVYTIVVTAADGNGGTVTDTFTYTVTNPIPTAINNSYTVVEDAASAVIGNAIIDNSVAGIDSDPDGDTLTALVQTNVAGSAGGLFSIDAAGSVTFNPNGEFNTLAVGELLVTTFSCTITDGEGGSATAVVSVTVTGANDAPVAVNDVIKTNEDTPVVLNLLGNDTDPDGDPLTLTSINGTPITPGVAQTIAVSNGTVTVSVDGVVTFTPALDYNGPIQFSYEVQDPSGAIGRAFVTVNVAPVEDAVLFEQLLPQPINFGEYYYPAEYHWETLKLPESMPQDLFVTYSVQESQNQVAKNSALGMFNADTPTANEQNNFTFDLKGLPVGMDPNLFVQHAVRGVPVTPEPNLFVQNAVRQSQAESMARNIGVTSINTATSGVVSMLNPFEIGSPHGAVDLSIDGVQGEFAKKSTTGTDAAALSDPKVDDLASAKQRAEIDRLIAETVAAEQALERSATDNRTQKPNAETKQQANKQVSAASFSNQLNSAAKKLKPNATPLKN